MSLHEGGCLCGAVRFEAEGPADRTVHCHCVFCRRQTGAPFATYAGFRLGETFRWVAGTPSTFKSSPAVRRRFCRRCGTPISFEADRYPGRIYIGIGSFDDPNLLPPQAHDHWAGKLAWLRVSDGLPRQQGSSVPAASTPPVSENGR